MTSRPKPRRKQPPEPLDWRELAEAPALRGLAEVLSTPAVAQPLYIPAVVAPTVVESPSEVGSASEVVRPPVVDSSTAVDAPTAGDPPTVVVSPPEEKCDTGIETPPEGGPTTVVVTLTEGDPPTVGDTWIDATGTHYAPKRVRSVLAAEDSLTLGEERVYQTLWHGRETDGILPESPRSKTFSLGYDRIARLVRLNEKSVRVLMPKLIGKKILEVVKAENSASRIGRTYRIFDGGEILQRQRAANLTHVVKNGRAVEFVWPNSTHRG